jgi:linoleoyl-CoA desaturase
MPSETCATFQQGGPFTAELKRRVDAHFAAAGIDPTAPVGMYFKTLVMLTWCGASWFTLIFVAEHFLTAALACTSLGLAMAGIGFNVMHDGGHRGYSRSPLVNRAMAYTLDLIGASSYVWNWKHNVFHHTNPNIVGLDADIDIRPFARMAPSQPHRPFHRFQHLYMWPLYAFLSAKWHFFDDFDDVARARIADHTFPRPRGLDLLGFVLGKVLFFTLVLAIPLLRHPPLHVLLAYAYTSSLLGVTLAIVFQAAHCAEGMVFVPAHAALNSEWTVHQIVTSADFAQDSWVASWLLGGLNFQIEHHLFPRICHMHLPRVAPIVEQLCREYGLPYRTHRTVLAAFTSHGRWLRAMGAAPVLPVVVPAAVT